MAHLNERGPEGTGANDTAAGVVAALGMDADMARDRIRRYESALPTSARLVEHLHLVCALLCTRTIGTVALEPQVAESIAKLNGELNSALYTHMYEDENSPPTAWLDFSAIAPALAILVDF